MNKIVLYFGGNDITVSFVSNGVNNTFVDKAVHSVPYSGIVNGEFVDNTELQGVISRCVKETFEKQPKFNADGLCIGVPSDFCRVEIFEAEKIFKRPSKITPKNVEQLLNSAKSTMEGFTPISRRAVYHKIDDGKPVIDAVGFTAKNSLATQISIISVSNEFIKTVGQAVARKFRRVEFLPLALAESLYLIDRDIRDSGAVLISFQTSSTSVMFSIGDSICSLSTDFQGSAHFINDVSIVMKKGYLEAKKMVANPTDKVKDIIMARLETLAEHLYSAIKSMDAKLFSKPHYICGELGDGMEGIVDFLSTALGVKVTKVACPLTDEPDLSDLSRRSLVNLALFY